jgi:serine/threonine protein kinase
MASLPSRIGRYEIKSLIGKGGMGNLYLADDPNTDRLVAVKLLNTTLDSTELRDRFAREARALAALNHPNIVSIYDTGEYDDSPFIVMEYVRGETLAEMIKRRAKLSISQKLKLMAELCAGLAQAHEAGIIHRDIKPANLMVDQQGRLKILDFGIARVAEDNRTRVGLTQVNMMIGTPGYMSPEQMEGGEVDHRSDIFAVGAVCYELLSYDVAFSGTDTRQIQRSVLEGQPTRLASLIPGLDPEVDEVVLRALKRDPNKRYQDAATFEKALDGLRSRIGADAPAPPRRPTPPPPLTARVESRQMRAEAAYQRADADYQAGAPDVARRSAIEALAEDPSHARARALLARLERAPRPSPSQSVPPHRLPGTASRTSVSRADPTVSSTSVNNVPPPMVSASAVASTSASGAPSTIASAPTLIIPHGGDRTPTRKRVSERLRDRSAPLRRLYEQLWKRDSTWKRHEPLWARYPRTTQATALLVVVAIIVTIAFLFTGSLFWPSGQLLTITMPVGGTISAAGILCGTRGSDCSTRRRSGEAIELTPDADAGYVFVGYTGDCAPSGRTIMKAPRTCSATFDRVAPAPQATMQLLTIAPVPVGGTLAGAGIQCGTQGSICSTPIPNGELAVLHQFPDPGYTFTGFQEDCKGTGQTQMNGPRTCSATFVPIADVAAAPNPIALPPRVRGGRNSGEGVSPPPTSGEPGSRPSPGPRAVSPPPGTAAPQTGPNVEGPQTGEPQKPPTPPPTDEAYAKDRIKELLKAYCAAYEAIDPDAVQRLQPKVPISTLRMQLNKFMYKSVMCKFGDPEFLALDPLAGTGTVRAELKRVYEFNAGPPRTDEQIATIKLRRSEVRSPWLIDVPSFTPKPK